MRLLTLFFLYFPGKENVEKICASVAFDNEKWILFAFLKKKSKRVTLIAEKVVYLPVYYINGRVRPFNYPFVNEKVNWSSET